MKPLTVTFGPSWPGHIALPADGTQVGTVRFRATARLADGTGATIGEINGRLVVVAGQIVVKGATNDLSLKLLGSTRADGSPRAPRYEVREILTLDGRDIPQTFVIEPYEDVTVVDTWDYRSPPVQGLTYVGQLPLSLEQAQQYALGFQAAADSINDVLADAQAAAGYRPAAQQAAGYLDGAQEAAGYLAPLAAAKNQADQDHSRAATDHQQVVDNLAGIAQQQATNNTVQAQNNTQTASAVALAAQAAGIISSDTYAAIPTAAGYYRVLSGAEAGQVYQRTSGGTLTRQLALEAWQARQTRPALNPYMFGLTQRGDASSPLQTLINEAATTRTSRRTVIDLDGLDVDHTSSVTIPATLGRVVLSGGTLRQSANGLLDVAAGLDRLVMDGMTFDGLNVTGRNNGAVYNRARITEIMSGTFANYPKAAQGVIKIISTAPPEVIRVADTELNDCYTGLLAGTNTGLQKLSVERTRMLNTFGTGVVTATTSTTITLSDVDKTLNPWRLMAPWIREWRVGEYIRVSRMAAGTVGGYYLITGVSRSGSSVTLTVATDPSAAVAAGDESISVAGTSSDALGDFVQLNETRSGSYPCQIAFRDNFAVNVRMAEEIQNRSADVQSSGNAYHLSWRYGISHPDGYRSRVDRDTLICPIVADGGAYGIEHTTQRDGRVTDCHVEGGYGTGVLVLASGSTTPAEHGGVRGNTFALTRGGDTSDIQLQNTSGTGTAPVRNYRIRDNISRSITGAGSAANAGTVFVRVVNTVPAHVDITDNQIIPDSARGPLVRAPGGHFRLRGNRAIYPAFAGERDALIVHVGQATAPTTVTAEDNIIQMPTDRPYYMYRTTSGRTTISTTSSEQGIITRRNTVLAGTLNLHDGSTAYAQEYNSGTNTGSTIRWITERNLGLMDSNVARTVTAGAALPVRSEIHTLTAASAVTTADPALPDGREIGQRVTYINTGTNTITVKQGTKVQLGADLALAANQSLTLTWSGAAWIRTN